MAIYQTLIFIPEGSLLAEKAAQKRAMKQILDLKHLPFNAQDYAQLLETLKPFNAVQRDELLLKHYAFHDDLKQMQTRFDQALSQQATLIKGAEKVLKRLHGQAQLILLGRSQKARLLPRLQKAKIASEFNACFFADDFNTHLPNPQVFKDVLSHLNADPNTTLVIGTSLSDEIQGAAQAKLDSLWLAPKREKVPITPHPTLHVSQLSDLLFYLNLE